MRSPTTPGGARLLEPTFGGINLEDIRAPECFEIERRLKAEMSIPVFHDDQHGTAIISGAALLNALVVVNKRIEDVRIVFSGAGAAAISCARLYVQLGARRENLVLCDRHGVIFRGREQDMEPNKQELAADTPARTLADAMAGADVFVGLSIGGVVTPEMVRSMARGREYLIPKPFDYRVLLRVPPAVARAAMESGVARVPIPDFAVYQWRLETLISRRLELMHGILDRARRSPRRVVFPEGEHEQILRAAKILVDEGIAHPILLARREVIAERLQELDLPEDRFTLIHHESSERFETYARRFHEKRRRDGITLEDARKRMRLRNYFGTMMVEMGDADGLISGLTQSYPDTIRPALQIVGTRHGVRRVSGAYVLILQDRLFFFADTTVNIEPTPEELAEIALLTVGFARRFGVVPRVAMLSFSNFGSNTHPAARKVRRAVEIVAALEPDLEVDGEMQADTAVFEQILHESYPWSRLKAPANVLIFPELQSANTAYKLIWRLAGAEAIGPVLLGMAKPIHVLQSGLEVSDIVNMTALCVVDAQELDG